MKAYDQHNKRSRNIMEIESQGTDTSFAQKWFKNGTKDYIHTVDPRYIKPLLMGNLELRDNTLLTEIIINGAAAY